MTNTWIFVFVSVLISAGSAGRGIKRDPSTAASQQIEITKNTGSAGYRYPVPAASFNIPSQTHTVPPTTVPPPDPEPVPSPAQSQTSPQQVTLREETEIGTSTAATSNETTGPVVAAAAATPEEHVHHSPVIEAIDVACGKERMTVRVTFDQPFNGIIYAKGHYSTPACRFVPPNSGKPMYQFDLTTGQCGVAFIDAGLTDGGQAYVEGLLVIINEPGVQEAWDAARKIRCLWEGSLEQTVTFPLAVNMLDSKLLTFSGDTATVSLEIQNGVGPKAPVVQGLVGIGDHLTAVVTVQGDAEFDLLVRNCVATDGTADNRIILSDGKGCAVKPKLMGGWTKEKSPAGGMLAFSELSAFKFPDVMDLFLECTVSLCKGDCEECPNYLTLHVPNHDHDTPTDTDASVSVTESASTLPPTTNSRARRSVNYNQTYYPEESSLQIRRGVQVVGPDDLPEFSGVAGTTVYGNGSCYADCVPLIGIVTGVAIVVVVMTLLALFGSFRRRNLGHKC